jgi:hypothetical protein
MIEVYNFYKLKNDSMKEWGFSKNDPVFIGGSGFVPDSKTDPFKFRLVFIGVKVEDGHIKVGESGFTIDGKNLSKCNKQELTILEKNKEEDFANQQAPAAQQEEAV